jgi:phage terminase large subunit-like protein
MKKTPQEYWQDAREYIKKLESELSIEDKYYVDRDFAMKCIKFGSLMKLTAGEFAVQPFMYQQWQIEAIVNIFGVKYKHGDFKGLRRYKKALLFTPKKSGKTAFGSLLTMIYFFLDKEKAKECYSIASEIEQAKILWKSFVTMIRQEDELMDMVHITKQPPKVSKMSGAFIDEYTALSSTADSKDGLNVIKRTSWTTRAFRNIYEYSGF